MAPVQWGMMVLWKEADLIWTGLPLLIILDSLSRGCLCVKSLQLCRSLLFLPLPEAPWHTNRLINSEKSTQVWETCAHALCLREFFFSLMPVPWCSHVVLLLCHLPHLWKIGLSSYLAKLQTGWLAGWTNGLQCSLTGNLNQVWSFTKTINLCATACSQRFLSSAVGCLVICYLQLTVLLPAEYSWKMKALGEVWKTSFGLLFTLLRQHMASAGNQGCLIELKSPFWWQPF